MALVTASGNYFTTFVQPNKCLGGFFHNGKSLLRFTTPNETSFILNGWGLTAKEIPNDPKISVFSRDQILEDGTLSNDVSENYVKIEKLDFEDFLGYNNDYGYIGQWYYENW